MRIRQAAGVLAGVVSLVCAAAAGPLRPPSVPLVTVDPFFSVWSPADRLTDAPTEHWSGARQPINAVLRVDGKAYRLLGTEPADAPALPQTGVAVWPLRTVATFSDGAVEAELVFATPLLTDNLDVFSRPVTYVTFKAKARDGRSRAFQLEVDVAAAIAVGDDAQPVVFGEAQIAGLDARSMGRDVQPVLGRSGDRVRIDWGRFWLAAPTGGRITVRETRPALVFTRDFGAVASAETHLLLAYDDVESVMFFNRPLKAWWRRHGLAFTDMLAAAERDYSSLDARMAAFDAALMADLTRVGGEKYAALAALAHRQSFAACKLVADPNGQPLYFSKENASNGCMGTVDVFYPQLPHLALLSPTLTRATLAPILLYASDARWPFDFAPHDIGQYPLGNGQRYGGGERGEENQMPVEECGNMLICLGALSHVENRADFAAQWWPTVTRWAEYLAAKGFDPDNQLCTDDFAGHLAHNANLSIKAIMGLACYGKMAALNGDAAAAERFTALAKSMVPKWIEAAKGGRGGAYRLAFDQPDTWSMKYNLVWDRALGLNLFPAEVAATEMAFYRTALQKYGLPLDSRKLWTKADWQVWTATLTGRREDFDALIAPLHTFLHETPDRIPFGDWYETDSAKHCHFRARSVVGGVFMPMLQEAALWQKYAARDTGTTGLYAPLAPKTAAQPSPFRIATFNIRLAGASVAKPADRPPNSWTCRVDRVCALIAKQGFDLIGLQEAQANQIDDMLARMGAAWAYVGVGREDGRRGGEYSCIFYRTNRFAVTRSGTFWLSETPEVPGSKSWETACPRVCTWADMKDLKTGKTFVCFNTHLDHMSKEARRNGMALILARMARVAQGRPVLLTGDMNATPEKRPVDAAAVQADFKSAGPKEPHAAGGPYAIATANLRDSFDVTRTPHAGPIKTFSGFKYVEHPEGQPIDYIFVSAGVDVLTHATLNDSENQLYPSDHFPVSADVSIE
ncbi:MAG: DUF4965 domain-containing protein [Kiritimatiellia bacterium]|nr:DUF4965 domain-containing protein [Kiritimatiellia bacterium]